MAVTSGGVLLEVCADSIASALAAKAHPPFFGDLSCPRHLFFDVDTCTSATQTRVRKKNQTKERAKRKVHEFRPFLRNFWCFSLGKQARFTLSFCSGVPLRKVHELTFLWFGLPGPLLIGKGVFSEKSIF